MSTVLTCAVAAVLVAVTVVVIGLAAAIDARGRAGGSADLAALAAAGQALSGSEIACATAGRVATANGARMVSCRVAGLWVWITTSVQVEVGLLDGAATGHALAGPVGEVVG
ncbi:flp pilus-assembly TadE/G-like family protein [Nakamurella flavida]|uniref:Flp pilus-assembly TadE/G-like family protein n=1 Tax=Nakamurella flavida TaxID=363630 RepID=A0A938YEM1_9ACTN|nr:Rv3654c family TadE-like protein [Nakamurella flavida]MBM9476256.1 flp pilus-assembly TadE/G-like family protein [Nakamurella flavida]MDP9779646.1 secretion/DNA translocation related TadE-like protein [Nakamurella flavida]